MRNLKKILALVLALIMSLSLMATAGASSFPDVDDENPYATAIEVLDALKVFQGYKEDGTFRPTETLNRAQAAVLVYRVATGDVEDKYLDNYTFMQQSKFEDLDGYNWAKGYINYCQNAKIVVGTSATTFEPGKKVTGYELLVMLLRTLGYGQAGEFSDPKGWELQTAAIAEREGILKNVTKGDLGAAAPRQMVAEVLFRAMLTEKVAYSPLTPNGYTKSGVTLGYEQFKLESVTGVVMANEWANLNDEANNKGDKVLAAGKTEMLLADGTTYNVAISSDLDVVGQTCTAYMADQDNDGVREALTERLTADAINVVDYNEGAAKTVSGLATTKLTNDTQWYKNYSENWFEEATSDYLIRYAVAKADVDKVPAWEEFINVTVKDTVSERKITATVLVNGKKVERDVDCYVRMIQPGKEITEIDQAIMKSIFYTADRLVESNVYTDVQDYVYGEVYVGTASTKDVSDTMSWVGFQNEYFTVDVNTKKFAKVGNGDSLRIIDNNGDGNAEYVLWIAYTQAKAIDTINDSLLLSSGLRMSKYTDNNLDAHDELALNDIANYYVIDNKLSIWKADVVTDTIKTKNFKDVTVTLSDGTEKGQSDIVNATALEDNVLNMSDKPEYNMYLDEYGYIRTYELAQGKKYALLTEMYGGALQNWNYVTSTRWIAEMKAGNTDKVERVVANNNSPFITANYAWTSRNLSLNGNVSSYNNLNYLQPATAHLGLAAGVAGTAIGGSTPAYRNVTWNRNVFAVGLDEMFDYGRVTYTQKVDGTAATVGSSVANSFSFTNVAVYSLEDEAVSLETAAKKHTNTAGEQLYRARVDLTGTKANDTGVVQTKAKWIAAYLADNRNAVDGETWFKNHVDAKSLYEVYATDYVQLAKGQSYAAGTRHYTIADTYETKYNTLSNDYVDATVNTEYYIVTPNNVEYKVGYDNLYTIDGSKVRAAYAVAQNTAKDSNGEDYWVADVIVIEVDDIIYDYDSISLMYCNPWETSGQVRNVNSLNNQWRTLQPDYDGLAKMDIVPARVSLGGGYVNWGNTTWTSASYGFYRLYGTEPTAETNGNLTAADAKMITADWNKFGIYAGTVKRITEIYSTSGYIDIDLDGDNLDDSNVIHVTVNSSTFKTPVYRVNGTTTSNTSAETINLLNDPSLDKAGVQIGDPVIVVYNNTGKGQAAYLVDVRAGADLNKDGYLDWNVPGWLSTLYSNILKSEGAGPATTATLTITKQFRKADGTAFTPAIADQVLKVKVPAGDLLTITDAKYPEAGYVLSDVTNATPSGGDALTVTDGAGAPPAFYTCADDASANAPLVAGANYGLTFEYRAVDSKLTVTNSTTQADTTIDYKIGTGAMTNGRPNNTTANFDDDYTVTVTMEPGYSYKATIPAGTTAGTITSQAANGAGKYVITGKITGALNVTVTRTRTNSTNVTVATPGGDNATVTFTTVNTLGNVLTETGTTANYVTAGTPVSFTVAPATNYVIASVTYTVGGTSKGKVPVSGGVYTIPGADTLSCDPIVVTVTAVPDTAVNVTFADNATATVHWATGTDGVSFANQGNPTPVSVTPVGELWVKTDVGVKLTSSVATVKLTPNADYTIWHIENITAATAISFVDLAPAAMAALSVNGTTGAITATATGAGDVYLAVVNTNPNISALANINTLSKLADVSTALAACGVQYPLTAAANLTTLSNNDNNKWLVGVVINNGTVSEISVVNAVVAIP